MFFFPGRNRTAHRRAEAKGGDNMKKSIEFHIIATEYTTLEEVFNAIKAIKREHPNAKIDVEVSV